MATLSKPHSIPLQTRAGALQRREKHVPDMPRFDLLQLAAEAAEDKSYDESARVRVTQQDIRRLLERRRKEPK